jgi:hypothetical protein
VPLFLGAFALAAERSSLSDYLAAAAISEDFEPLPEPAEIEEESDLRRGERLLSKVPDRCANLQLL